MGKIKQIASKNLNTLFSRFLIIFLLLGLILVAIIIFNLIYENKKQELYILNQRSENIKTLFFYDNILINDFFIHDLISSNFFESNKSRNISEHDSIFELISQEIEFITSQKAISKLDKDEKIEFINNQLVNYNQVFDSIVELSLKRGFKDYGFVGSMRKYAHILEELNHFDNAKLLMLRRHEKDYIIRGQEKYVYLFQEKKEQYLNQILHSSLSVSTKDTISIVLNLYEDSFLKVVVSDSILGIKDNTGLTKQLSEKRKKLEECIEIIIKDVDSYLKTKSKQLKFLYVFFSFFLVVINFVGGLLIIRHLTRPISKLSKNIKLFVESDFEITNNFEYKTTVTELVGLIDNYFSMKEEILLLLNDFQKQVEQRTEEVKTQAETIEKQKIKVEKINQKMVSSIKYAKKIQQAILPNEDILNDNFKEHFVIYKPKDIVSGDFLWFRRIKNKKFDIKLIAVADCTGHGVPGALMSMLSIAYLNEIVQRKEIISANKVLEVLRLNIVSNFQHDGLDLAFIIIHEDKKKIEFAGANRNVYIKRNEELITLKGNRMPIGKYPTTDLFVNQKIEYQKDDEIFAFSDGITDQLNENGHKFSSKEFIANVINEENFTVQKRQILSNFYFHKKNAEQTDDILVFGAVL